MALINTKIKSFKADAFKDGEFITIDSDDLNGKWSVFFFYPADFTFVCPTELEDVADYYDEFKSLDVEIYAISTDSHFCHKAWHDSSESISKIKYPMISDSTFKISKNLSLLLGTEVGLRIGDSNVSSLNFGLGGYSYNHINNYINMFG